MPYIISRLTCGTTWHSVGLIGCVREDESSTRILQYSRNLYQQFEQEEGGGLGKFLELCIQGPHRLEKYLNIQDCLESSLKIKYALKST